MKTMIRSTEQHELVEYPSFSRDVAGLQKGEADVDPAALILSVKYPAVRKLKWRGREQLAQSYKENM